jgi:multidrug resistance efflux pump
LSGCAILTVALITIIFYYHPSTTNVSSFFRTVTILSEGGGRVAEVYVTNNQRVEAGEPLFKLDDASQAAAAETARRQIAEIDASLLVAQSDLAAAIGVANQARANLQQTIDELGRKKPLFDKGSGAVSRREIERLENLLNVREGTVESALANQEAVEIKISTLLPAQKASAEAALEQANTELAKMMVYAGTSGTVQQFTLQPGDIVNPILRPAGILVPELLRERRFQAGFGQISSQVIRPSAGQIRPSDQLLDLQDQARPGTITAYMEPLYAGQTDDIPSGSKCIANAYTSNHDLLDAEDLSTPKWLFYHMVDTVGLVHALLLRIQALVLPVQTLVFSGH